MFISLGVQCASRFWIAVILSDSVESRCRVTSGVYSQIACCCNLRTQCNSWLIVRVGPQTKVWPKIIWMFVSMICSRTRLICRIHYTDLRNRSVWYMIQINWFFFIIKKSNIITSTQQRESFSPYICNCPLFFSPECVLQKKERHMGLVEDE